jgi:hypothetical protein
MDIQIEKQINNYYTFSKAKYYAHLQAAIYYKSWYNYTTVPIILISSITTILASYNGNYNDQPMAVVVAVVSGITTIVHAFAAFFEFDAKSSASLTISNKYINLVRHIENNFFMNYLSNNDQMSSEAMRSLFNYIQNELTNIQSIESTLPQKIANADYANSPYGTGKISDSLIDIPALLPNSTSINIPTLLPTPMAPIPTNIIGMPSK